MKKVWNVEQLAQAGHDIHKLETASRITTAQNRIDKAKADEVSIIISVLSIYILNVIRRIKSVKKFGCKYLCTDTVVPFSPLFFT